MEARYIQVKKSARYYVLGKPGPSIKTVWFACHGYMQLAKYFQEHFRVLDDGETLIVVPEALSRAYQQGENGRVGASWMTKEDRLTEIDDYVAYLEQLYDHIMEAVQNPEVKVVVLGFSQGSSTVCRWLANGRSKAHHLLIWAGVFPPDLDLVTDPTGFRGLDIKLLLGTTDPYVNTELVENQKAFLEINEIPYELIRYEDAHRIIPEKLQEVARGL